MLEICWAFASSIFESQQHLAGRQSGSSARLSSSGTWGPYVLVPRFDVYLSGFMDEPLSHYSPHTYTNIPWRPKADLIPGLRLQIQTQNRTLVIIRKMVMKTYCRLKVMIIFCLHIQYQYWSLIVHFQFNQSWHFATLISVHICVSSSYIYCTIYTWQTALKVASFKSHKIQLNNVRNKKVERLQERERKKKEKKRKKEKRRKIVLAARAGK